MADETTKDPYGPNGRVGRPSAGRLMKEVTEDLSTLVRKEIELAKQELGQAAAAKATGAVVIAIVGALAFFALIFLLLALRDGLDEIFWKWVADLLTAAILLLIGAIGALFARRKLATPIKADLTKQTIKEDVEFAKNIGRRSSSGGGNVGQTAQQTAAEIEETREQLARKVDLLVDQAKVEAQEIGKKLAIGAAALAGLVLLGWIAKRRVRG